MRVNKGNNRTSQVTCRNSVKWRRSEKVETFLLEYERVTAPTLLFCFGLFSSFSFLPSSSKGNGSQKWIFWPTFSQGTKTVCCQEHSGGFFFQYKWKLKRTGAVKLQNYIKHSKRDPSGSCSIPKSSEAIQYILWHRSKIESLFTEKSWYLPYLYLAGLFIREVAIMSVL